MYYCFCFCIYIYDQISIVIWSIFSRNLIAVRPELGSDQITTEVKFQSDCDRSQIPIGLRSKFNRMTIAIAIAIAVAVASDSDTISLTSEERRRRRAELASKIVSDFNHNLARIWARSDDVDAPKVQGLGYSFNHRWHWRNRSLIYGCDAYSRAQSQSSRISTVIWSKLDYGLTGVGVRPDYDRS